MSAAHDFAHNRVANDRRHGKALRLRSAAIHLGLTPPALQVAIAPDAGKDAATLRRQIRKLAGLDREPSTESWLAALVELERRPPAIATDTAQAPCGCWPAHDTGVLYEFPPAPGAPFGWPCGHHLYADRTPAEIPAGVIACGPRPATAGDVAQVLAYADYLAQVGAPPPAGPPQPERPPLVEPPDPHSPRETDPDPALTAEPEPEEQAADEWWR